jgi:hypothetical protein
MYPRMLFFCTVTALKRVSGVDPDVRPIKKDVTKISKNPRKFSEGYFLS